MKTYMDNNVDGEIPKLAADWPTSNALHLRYVNLVIKKCGGNKTKAAAVLGMDRRTINRTLQRERVKAKTANPV